MKYLFAVCVSICISLSVFAQRDTIAVNDGWHFLIDKNADGLNQKWFTSKLTGARKVVLPHTWNIENNNQNHYGWGWYQKEIHVSSAWKAKNIILEFGAINHTALIYLNGTKIHENIGDGFNKVYVKLDDKLNFKGKNILTVAVNNDYGRNKVPFGNSFDWPNDGGLIRKARLIVSGKPSAAYLNVKPVLNLNDFSGKLDVRVGFDNPLPRGTRLSLTVREENQLTKEVVYNSVISQVSWAGTEARFKCDLSKVNPWHFDHPNLYRVDVTILDGKRASDKISADIGFRDMSFKDGKTYLNGERIRLMGIEWTAGSNPDFGFAETDAEIIRHGKLMKDVNAVFSRLHFQQDDLFYDFCNRNGILLQEEVPLWGPETPANDTIEAIAHSQLTRMIRNHYNHPSIFSWGVGNELRGRDEKMKAMIQSLIDKARKLDDSRMVAYVSNTLKEGFNTGPSFVPDAGSLGDYLMMNEYSASWWAIPQAELSNYLDSIHHSYPDKPLFISEFGLCGPNFKGGDERRLEDLIYHMAVYETKPYIEGAIYFDLTDYRTHYPGTTDNNKFRRRVHGVYDMYGKPKPSSKTLRELSSPIEVQRLEKKKGKLAVLMFGSFGLPQHSIKGYRLYLSDKNDNYKKYKSYELPVIKPGEKFILEIDDLFNGKGIITVVRPTGYIATQKPFYE